MLRPPKDFVIPRAANCGTDDIPLASRLAARGGYRATRTAEHLMAPAIHIGPDAPERLVGAVQEGGGTPVALEQAEGSCGSAQPDELPDLPSR